MSGIKAAAYGELNFFIYLLMLKSYFVEHFFHRTNPCSFHMYFAYVLWVCTLRMYFAYIHIFICSFHMYFAYGGCYYRIPEFLESVLDTRICTLDSGRWTLSSRHWTLLLTSSKPNQNSVSDSAWLNYWIVFGCESLRTSWPRLFCREYRF